MDGGAEAGAERSRFLNFFGSSVAIDSLTVVVGAPAAAGPQDDWQGAAYVFEFNPPSPSPTASVRHQRLVGNSFQGWGFAHSSRRSAG